MRVLKEINEAWNLNVAHVCVCTCRIFLCRACVCVCARDYACTNEEARNWTAALRSGFGEWFRVISAFHPTRRPAARISSATHRERIQHMHAESILRRASAAQGHFRTPPARGWRQRTPQSQLVQILTHTPHTKSWRCDKSSAQMQPTRFELPESLAPLRSSQ
jgi:hypothetical protein